MAEPAAKAISIIKRMGNEYCSVLYSAKEKSKVF